MSDLLPIAGESPAPRVRVAEGIQLRSAALELLLSDSDGAQPAGVLAEELAGRLSLAGLFSASREEQLVGSVWGLAQPGKTALIWPPRLIPGEPETTANLLLSAVECYLAGVGIRLAQAALPTNSSLDAQRLVAHGYVHTADLLYLECGEEAFPCERPVCTYRLDVFTPGDETRLAELVERTYEQTCDCPELNGVRDPADVLEGFRETGKFAAERWLLVVENGQDLGCLLLADHPAEDQWELVYMGLAPQARGRGLGLALTRHAQWLTRQAGRCRLVLAVDARNQPALAVYGAARFRTFDRRSVFLKTLDTREQRY